MTLYDYDRSRPSVVNAPVSELIAMLRGVGVDVANGVQYEKLKAAYVTVPPLKLPDDPFTLTADELVEFALDQASRAVAAETATQTLYALKLQLDEAMRVSMAADADSYLDQMRPAFDKAADAARTVTALGVQPDDDAETVIARGADAAAAWLEFKQRHVGTLQKMSRTRAGLARALGVGEGADGDHAAGITDPFIPGLLDRPVNEPPHVAWLQAAANLHLVPFGDMDQDVLLAGEGFDVGAIHDAGLQQFLAAIDDEDDQENYDETEEEDG